MNDVKKVILLKAIKKVILLKAIKEVLRLDQFDELVSEQNGKVDGHAIIEDDSMWQWYIEQTTILSDSIDTQIKKVRDEHEGI